MTYYYRAADERVAEFDADLMAAWVAAANPKAQGWVEIADPPSPAHTWDGSQWVAPPPYVPSEVTMRQARLALLAAGKLSLVDAAIASMPEPHRSAAQITWEYSNAVQRHNAFTAQLGPALGLTEAQMDQLFITAAAIP